MSRDVTFGILVKAKNATGAGFADAKKGAESFGKGVKDAAERAKAGMKSLGAAVVVLNQGMEIAKKVAQGVSMAFALTVGKTLEQRRATDSGRVAWEAFGKQVSHIQGLIGDILLPLLLGIGDAFKPLLDSTEKWLTKNRELVGSQIIGFLTTVSKALVSGVATGVIAVTRVWGGWKLIISTTQSTINGFFASTLSGISKVLEGLGLLALASGKGELAEGLYKSALAAKELGGVFQDTADVALGEAAKEAAALKVVEDQIRALEKTLTFAIGDAGVKAFARLQAAVSKTGGAIEELADTWYQGVVQQSEDRALEKVLASAANHARQTSFAIRQIGDAWTRSAEDAIAADAKMTAQAAELESAFAGAFSTIRSSVTEAFADMGTQADGTTKGIGEAFGQLFKGLGAMILENAANYVIALGIKKAAEEVAMAFTVKTAIVEAEAKSVAAYAGIPVAGIGLGLAAAATIAGIIAGFAGTFHEGGMIPGRRGEESYARVMAGELVVPPGKAQAALAAGFGPGGTPRSSGGGGPTTVRVETLLPSRASVDTTDREFLGPSRRRRARLGAEF